MGGHCVQLLKHLDQLKVSPKSYNVWTVCAKIVAPFCAFKAVCVSCFGQLIHPSYKNSIDAFAKAYCTIGIPITPKVHAVCIHIIEFLELEQKKHDLPQDLENLRIVLLSRRDLASGVSKLLSLFTRIFRSSGCFIKDQQAIRNTNI